LDSAVESEWKTLLATKPMEPDVAVVQEFCGSLHFGVEVAGPGEQYDSFHQQEVQVIPELGPPFEGSPSKEVEG
jgi:hypothetical protein